VSHRVPILSLLEVTLMTMLANAHILMCRPQHFAVSYAINPWMDPSSWARDQRVLTAAARREWTGLHRALQDAGAQIDLVPAKPGLPDLVFTANAAVVLDGKALLARFRHPERRAEEPHFAAAFRKLQARGLLASVRTLPEGVTLEGAGDCVWLRAALGRGRSARRRGGVRRRGGGAEARRSELLSHGHGALPAAGRRGALRAGGVHARRARHHP
jgi:hypothetical protein